jgi:hypothetical protein
MGDMAAAMHRRKDGIVTGNPTAGRDTVMAT